MELPISDQSSDVVLEWQKYKEILMCKGVPSEEELMRRWWRKMLMEFVSKTCKANNQMHTPRRFSTDDELFRQYPWIRPLWEAHKVKLNIIKPTTNDIIHRWWADRRRDFYSRWHRRGRIGTNRKQRGARQSIFSRLWYKLFPRKNAVSNRYSGQNRYARWGTDTGIEGKENTRLVYLSELYNYRRLTHNGFNFFLTIFYGNNPRFVCLSPEGYERWRMRFNIFASGIFTEWHPNTVLHHGELHVYYDLIPGRDRPWCLDFTFYYDDRPIESQVLSNKYDAMDDAWKDSLRGIDHVLNHQLFLPIRCTDFVNPKESLNQFLECQQNMLAILMNFRDSEEHCGYAKEGKDGNVGNTDPNSDRQYRNKNRAISQKKCVDSEGWITSSKNR